MIFFLLNCLLRRILFICINRKQQKALCMCVLLPWHFFCYSSDSFKGLRGMKVQSCCVPSHWLHPAPTASSTGSSNQPPCTPTAKLNSLAEAHQRGKTAFPLAVWLDGTAENNSWVLNTEITEFGPSCHFKREFIDWSDSSQAPAMVQCWSKKYVKT